MTTNALPQLDQLTAPVPGPGGAPITIAGSMRDGLATTRSPKRGRDRVRMMSRAQTWACSGGDALILDLRADQTPTPVAPTPAGPAGDGGTMTPERVFHEYLPRVYHLARRMLGNDADAEDVTQDVLVQVVRKLHTFRGDAALSTWLHRVTVKIGRAHRRKRSNHPERQFTDPMEHFLEDGHHARP